MNNTELLGAIGFAFTIVFPNLALMGLGFFMQRKNTIDTNFVDVASKLVFNFGLPCLLFIKRRRANDVYFIFWGRNLCQIFCE